MIRSDFRRGGVFSDNIFPVFSGAHVYIFFELFVEIIHIFVAYLFCNFIDLKAVFGKEFLE